MRKKGLQLAIVFALAAAGASLADEWVSLDTAQVKSQALGMSSRLGRISVQEASAKNVSMRTVMSGFYRGKRALEDGNMYDAVIVPGGGQMPVGHPDVPAFAQWILVPNGTELILGITPGNPVVFEKYSVPPVQPPSPNADARYPFTREDAIYQQNTNYPGVFAKAEPIRQIRGQSMTILWIYPYQYNPVSKVLSVYPQLEVTVTFIGEPRPVEKRLRSLAFDNLFRRMAPNADQVLSLPEPDKKRQPEPSNRNDQ